MTETTGCWYERFKVKEEVVQGKSGAQNRIQVFDFTKGAAPSPDEWEQVRVGMEALAQKWKAEGPLPSTDYRAVDHQPYAQLWTGYAIPIVGLGTWKSNPGQVKDAVALALRSGYRHIDAAEIYRNEHEVGEALSDIFQEGRITRGDVFVTSKLWNDDHLPSKVRPALLKTLKNLKTTYLDLYLIHWPVTRGPWGQASLRETWAAMEALVDQGMVRSIGVSNFSVKKLSTLMEGARILPAVCQVEIHPMHRNDNLISWCKEQGIHVTAYSPLGSPDSAAMFKRSGPALMEHPVVKEIAERTGHDVGQVLVRWALQHGTSVLPKSTSAERIKSNLDVCGWVLEESDFLRLSAIEPQARMVDGAFLLSRNGEFKKLEDLWDESYSPPVPKIAPNLNQRVEDTPVKTRPSHRGSTASHKAPSAALNSGHSIPLVGLGTWKARPGQVQLAVETAICSGYRHIDAASIYNNEAEVGAGLISGLQKSGISRTEIFVTSKLWNTDHARDAVHRACKQSLEKLQLDYLDLYLIHWPATGNKGDEVKPPLSETWKAMEDLVSMGLVRSIGVSNFSKKKLSQLMETAMIKPAVCQIEVHPYFINDSTIQWCKVNGIHVTAYSPLGSPDSAAMFKRPKDDPVLLKDPTVNAVSESVGRDPGQVLIRWALQHGTSVLPKSTNPERIKSNLAALDWEMAAEDYYKLCHLSHQQRMVDASFLCSPEGPYKTLQDLWDE